MRGTNETPEENPHLFKAGRRSVELEGVVAEPAGAASLAAAYKIRDRIRSAKVIVMITGGNIDPEKLSSWLTK